MSNDSFKELRGPNQGVNGMLRAGMAVVSVVAAVLLYMLIQSNDIKKSQQEVIEEKVVQLAETRIKLDSIMHQLDSKIAEIQQLGGDISELQKAKAKLELDKAQLLKNTSEEIASIKATYQTKIQNYESLLTIKEQEIQRLKAENTELASVNEDLSEENSTLKTEKSALANTAARIRAQKEDADIRNKALAEKVSRATALKTEFVKITGINQKGREFDDRRMRNDKLARLKISFMLAKNELTEHEKKTVFIRVLDPDGSTLFDAATGSGSFIFEGKDYAYTTKAEIYYDNINQFVEVAYHRGTAYRSGKYTVELFAEGFKIGTSGFEIK